MKILHVNKFFDRHGGAEVYLHELMEKQVEAGHEVHIFSTKDSKNEPTKDSRYFVERFDFSKREGVWKDLKKAKNFLWNDEAEHAIKKMIKEVAPDVIHLHNIYHHLSSSILDPIHASGIPCVMTLHDYNLASPNYALFDPHGVCEHGKNGRYWDLVRRRCITPDFFGNALAALEMHFTKVRHIYEKTVHGFLCPSKFMQKKMEEWGEPKEKLFYVPNPTDWEEKQAKRGGGYVLYAGRLSREKGLTSLVQAASSVPEIRIKIAGKGPEEARLRELAKTLKAKNIEFIGFVPKEKLRPIRDRADAVVLPTLSFENASGVLLEAMSAGLPCLATKTGGNPELVKDGENGWLIPPGDVEAWENAFHQFLQSGESEREKMGKAGRARIQKNHLWSQHLERVMEQYEKAGAKE